MKSVEVIRERLSDWHPVNDAPSLADETFGQLDADEVIRLAKRAHTDNVRAELRRKNDDGVPVYTSVLMPDDDGEVRRIYKQTALFEVDDYAMAVSFYIAEARSNFQVAVALVKDCKRRHDVQLSLPTLSIEGGAA